MDKLALCQELAEDNKIYFTIYKNGEIVKTKLSSMGMEDLVKLQRMIEGMSHKIWHTMHFRVFKCCPTCHVKRRKK